MQKHHKCNFFIRCLLVSHLIVIWPVQGFAQYDEGEWPVEGLPPAGDLPNAQPGHQSGEISGQSSTEYLPAAPPSWKKRGHHFGVGIAQPQSMGNQYNHYEKLFGQPKIHPTVWSEYYFYNLGVDFGFRSAISYYTARGFAARDLTSLNFPLEQDLTDAQVDRDQESRLTLIPVQAAGVVSFSPFRARWVILQAWFGMQWVYVQNTMSAKGVSGPDRATYLNSGWNEEQVHGAAISFDLSWMDPRSTYGMRVFGISGIYLTPFYEVQKSTKSNLGVYDRENYGLMFTFETIR